MPLIRYQSNIERANVSPLQFNAAVKPKMALFPAHKLCEARFQFDVADVSTPSANMRSPYLTHRAMTAPWINNWGNYLVKKMYMGKNDAWTKLILIFKNIY